MANLDSWQTELNIPDLGYLYSGLYYYFVNNSDASGVIANCPATVSCLYSPIIDFEDLTTITVAYDNDRFESTLNYSAYLWRITGLKNIDKVLGTFRKYKQYEKKSYKTWRNESRLYQYPYNYAMLVDYINPPMEIPYHLVRGNELKIHAKMMLSDSLSYGLYVENFKDDYEGQLELFKNTGALDVPCGSSAYAQYSATQKAQDMFNYQSQLQNLRFNYKSETAQNFTGALSSVMGSMLTGNMMGGFMNGLNVGLNQAITSEDFAMKQAQAIGLKNAQMKDLSNTPRTMINTSSDVSFSLANGKMSIDLYRMTITEEYAERLGEYFHRYGYTQNKFMSLKQNINSRYYFNYIQTVDANITSGFIPKSHLAKIKQIFDNGVTFWHFNHSTEMYNYDRENYEV